MTDETREKLDVPAPPDSVDRPRIGVDEWVERHEGRTERYAGVTGAARRLGDTIPWYAWLAAALAIGFGFGAVADSAYLLNVGVITLVYLLAALGLNVVVGWAGLLDLGYVAFLGVGAYGYAWFSSGHFGLHWPAELSVPLVVAGTAVVGLLIGLTSWRLQGDYLAIVTLFVLEIFGNLATNADRINFPHWGYVKLTNGSNGVIDLDQFELFGIEIASVRGYFFLALGAFAIVIAALYLLNDSRTGRAWRASREDPLAAELLSMPVKRLKLLAFVFGAGVAAFAGTIFAAFENAVYPLNFTPELLILIYAMVILGGSGSLAGVVLGAVAINAALELLRSPSFSGYLFYALLAGGLVVAGLRRWRWYWLAGVVAATVAFGVAARAIADAVWPRGTAGKPGSGGWIGDVAQHWTLLPRDPYLIGRYAFVALVVAVVFVLQLRGWWRRLALVPVLYLAACVWENVLVENAPATRLVLLGGLLVVLMNVRPQGLLGTSRVEIV